MPVGLSVKIDQGTVARLQRGPLKGALRAALRKAGATGLRDMRSEATKRVRARKRIKVRYVRDAITAGRSRTSDIAAMRWNVDVTGAPVPLSAYPYRETRKGVSVEVNRGKRTLLDGAFVTSAKSGHKGIFRRRGAARLPIDELLGSRPLDALMHDGEAEGVRDRGERSFASTFERVLPLEISKALKTE